MNRLPLAPHSDIAFDVEGGLLVTSVLADPPGIERHTQDSSSTRHFSQAWLRTPVAHNAPLLGRMVHDAQWELIDLEGRRVSALSPPPGIACDRVTINALSDEGTHAFGVVSAHASRHETMVVWDANSGEVLQQRPTKGVAPTAHFGSVAGAPVVTRLVGGVLECWRWREDLVSVIEAGHGAVALAIHDSVALVARGKTIHRHELGSGENLEPWPLPIRSIESLSSRGSGVAVGAGTSILLVREGEVERRHKAPAKMVALGPRCQLAGSDGKTLAWLDVPA